MAEHIAKVNGIDVCYETFGDPANETVLLVRGFGSQMIAWRDAFCEQIASEGFHVVRFDNRGVGLTSKPEQAWTLSDMATDGMALLDHLGIATAHVCGLSMGGMIVQVMAIEHRDRVLSMVSIMSSIGGADAVLPDGDALKIFSDPPATTREDAIEQDVGHRRIIGSPGFEFDEDDQRALAAASYDRCYFPQGRIGQMRAIQGAPSRRQSLGSLTIPVTVIHGTADPLVPPENGTITADAIPGAELVMIDGMGHDIPAGAWDTVVGAIAATARRT